MIAVAWAALILWPLVAVGLFRRFDLATAFCATILGGYLLLPTKVGLDLPVLPPFDKDTIPALAALALSLGALRRRKQGQSHHQGHHQSRNEALHILPGWLPRDPVPLVCLALLGLGALGTAMTNGDALFYGARILPGMRLYDGFSLLLSVLMMLVPFLLGRRVLASRAGQRSLLVTLVVAAAAYAVPALWEVRMSPQLNLQIYGFFQHSFGQHMRQGGFRPLVFLQHGLLLSIFLTLAVIAACGLYRSTQGQARRRWGLLAGGLAGVLVLSKSLGALLIALLLVPVTLLARPRIQILLAACIAGMVVLYPVLRAGSLLPIDRISATAQSISPERAQSLGVRLENEERLLVKARERPLFGWGGWNRNRVFDENGRDISITDGSWIIELGAGGWLRYLGIFGLLSWPLVALALDRRGRVDPVCGVLALMLAAKLLDLIPNSGLTPLMWLTAGALLGRVELRAADLAEGPAPGPETGPAPGPETGQRAQPPGPTPGPNPGARPGL